MGAPGRRSHTPTPPEVLTQARPPAVTPTGARQDGTHPVQCTDFCGALDDHVGPRPMRVSLFNIILPPYTHTHRHSQLLLASSRQVTFRLAVGQKVVVHRPVRPRPLSRPPQTGVKLNPRQLRLPGPHRHHLLQQLLHPAPAEPMHLGPHDRGDLCLEQWFSTAIRPHPWANALHVSMWRWI